MKYVLLGLGTLNFFSGSVFAATQTLPLTPQPTPCISATFQADGSPYWKNITLTLKNTCSQSIDLQNSTVTFENTSALNTSFWGDFAPLTYPDNALQISSQAQTGGKFLATLTLHFPEQTWAVTKLPPQQAIKIRYGVDKDTHVNNTVKVYAATPVVTGNIELKNTSVKPATVTQTSTLIHITKNGTNVTDVALGWNSSKTVNGVSPGQYTISPETVKDSQGDSYIGAATPSVLTINGGDTQLSSIKYNLAAQVGKINVKVAAIPAELSGYMDVPTVVLTQSSTGSSTSIKAPWNATTTVSQLKSGSSYNLSSANINFNDTSCTPSFSPNALIAAENSPPTASLTYQCTQVIKNEISVNVTGGPASASSLKLTFTPNNGTAPVSQTITLNNGSGTATVSLTQGVAYTMSADPISGYSMLFSPQPLIASAGSSENVTLSKVSTSGGRIIGYAPGWKTLPTAKTLAAAGYTHLVVAFGVFSTSQPGVITPAFDTVTKAYIDSLHQEGIKVVLSLGGALTSLPNTTVDFHQALSSASSADQFKQTFKNSLTSLMNQYGFDGFDIDIEHGINAGGTFAQPQGDIKVLADIINEMHAANPNMLITMAPQIANISATSGFDQTWGNYASLIMQTAPSLTWVGIQNYNAGCAFGIDQVCYDPNAVNDPNFSVAMAVDLLENWPAKLADGRSTGFQPYLGRLNPSQVVLGYLSANASGTGDGNPVIPTTTIKRALQCLKTATAGSTSCGTYIPPKAYGTIGGVFNWEITYDQNNDFKFATDLRNCVINGVCN